MQIRKEKGFTLIELLVVIAIIALLLAIVMPALGKAKIYAQKVICRSNIKQQSLGTLLYAEDNDTQVPIVTSAGNWLWDIAFWSTNQISDYAGFDNNDIFYCPSNRLKKSTDARFWQFSWVFSWGVDLTQEQPIRDENVLSIAQQQSEFRVMPNLYFFYKDSGPGSTAGTTPDVLPLSGIEWKDKWINKLGQLPLASSTFMIMDNIISEGPTNFFQITGGGVGANFDTYDSSNHKSNKRFSGTANYKPEGANVGYADGHADWRDFELMEQHISFGSILFWW